MDIKNIFIIFYCSNEWNYLLFTFLRKNVMFQIFQVFYSNRSYTLHNRKSHSHMLINIYQIAKYMNIFGNKHKIHIDACSSTKQFQLYWN